MDNANNWGLEIVTLTIKGSSYKASAGAVCSECCNLYGNVSTASLEKYGVTSEIDQVSLAFWYNNFLSQCGDWSQIACVST